MADVFAELCPLAPPRKCLSAINSGALRASLVQRATTASTTSLSSIQRKQQHLRSKLNTASTSGFGASAVRSNRFLAAASDANKNANTRGTNAGANRESTLANAAASGLDVAGELASDNGSDISADFVTAALPAATAGDGDDDDSFEVMGIDAYLVLPFANNLGYVNMTGAEIRAMMEVSNQAVNARLLQTNMRYILNPTYAKNKVLEIYVPAAAGPRPVSTAAADDWILLDDTATYTLMTSVYLIEGNDGYTDVFPTNYVDLGEQLSDKFIRQLRAKYQKGAVLDYPTMAEEMACAQSNPKLIDAMPAYCRGIITEVSRDEISSCSTDSTFCSAHNGQILFGAFPVNASACEQCSGLGICLHRRCTCSGEFTIAATGGGDDGTEPITVTVVDGAPTSGPWAGVVMVEGPVCSRVRTLWTLDSGSRGAVIAAAVIVMAFAAMCLVVVLWNYAHPIIRACSPFLCALMCVGGIIAGVGILTDGLYTSDGSCNATIWALLFAFSLIVGACVFKLHRIKQIVNAGSLQSKASYTELYVLLGTLGILIVNIVILIVFSIHEPARMTPEALSSSFSVGYFCRSDERVYTTVFLTVNGAILLTGLYLAVRTRSESANFGEAKYIGLMLVNFTVIAVIAFLVSFVVTGFAPEISIIIRGWLIAYIVISSLSLLFIPRFLLIFRGVTQVENYQAKSVTQMSGVSDAYKQAARDKRALQTLQSRLREREADVAARDKAIAEVTSLLANKGINEPTVNLTPLIPFSESQVPQPTVVVPGSSVIAPGGRTVRLSQGSMLDSSAIGHFPSAPTNASTIGHASSVISASNSFTGVGAGGGGLQQSESSMGLTSQSGGGFVHSSSSAGGGGGGFAQLSHSGSSASGGSNLGALNTSTSNAGLHGVHTAGSGGNIYTLVPPGSPASPSGGSGGTTVRKNMFAYANSKQRSAATSSANGRSQNVSKTSSNEASTPDQVASNGSYTGGSASASASAHVSAVSQHNSVNEGGHGHDHQAPPATGRASVPPPPPLMVAAAPPPVVTRPTPSPPPAPARPVPSPSPTRNSGNSFSTARGTRKAPNMSLPPPPTPAADADPGHPPPPPPPPFNQ